MATSYRIRLQPDPERTLQDPGTIEFTIDLTLSQKLGLNYIANALFTSWRDRNEPVFEAESRLQYFQPENGWVRPPINLIRTLGFVPDIYSSYFRVALNQGASWTSVITNPHLVELRSTIIIETSYTAIFLNYLNTTFGVIVGFNDLEFLQGAITLCQWFGLNWRDWIIDIHQGDRLMEVMNI